MGGRTYEKSDNICELNDEYSLRNVWFLFRIDLDSEMSNIAAPDDERSPKYQAFIRYQCY
jgi:hypothetical protein